MLKIELSVQDTASLEELDESLKKLEDIYKEVEKFEYDKRYDTLLLSEDEWGKYRDPITDVRIDMSIRMPDYSESDEEVMVAAERALLQIQKRRDFVCREKIRAISNQRRWKKLYFKVCSLYDIYEAFWLTIPEIKALRSSELRSSEMLLRMRKIFELKSKVKIYFHEGKHSDQGEGRSYDFALRDELENIDAKKDTIKQYFGIQGKR